MRYQYVEIPVLIEFPTEPAAVMNYTCQGRGDVLPEGAKWIGNGPWWVRPPTTENIQRKIDERNSARNAVGELLHPEAPVRWVQVHPTEIPQDRTYRNALCCVDGKVQHDMVKAREWHRKLLRHERAAKFQELDGQWMRAAGQGNKAEQDVVEVERQKWRDAPADPRIDAAQSVEELKQISVTSLSG